MGGRLRNFAIVIGFLSILVALAPEPARADARTDYLVRMLRTSSAFRVRAQAALSLGTVSPAAGVIGALTRALSDESGAVRAAAAVSLARQGDPSALPALRAVAGDPEAGVRTAVRDAIASIEARTGQGSSTPTRPVSGGAPRFYIGIGSAGAADANIDRRLVQMTRTLVERRVGAIEGVVVAPENEHPREAERELRARSMTGFYLDASIVSVAAQPGGGTRVQVSVVVQSYPDRVVRSMLQGSATATGGNAAQAALDAAIGAALRRLQTAMAAAPAR